MSQETFDKAYPHLVAITAALGYFLFLNQFKEYVVHPNMKELLTASATISSIAVGFLATSKATLLSINNSRVVKWMKDGKVYNTLIDYFMSAVHYCMGAAVYSAMLLLVNFTKSSQTNLVLVTGWVFLSVGSLLASYRVIRLYSYILRKN
ncbi:MAG: hypothetical protein AB7I29_03670 [Geobacter sp.]